VTSTLPSWLATRSESELAGILARRPDTLSPDPPDDLDELAERLHHTFSIGDVLAGLPLPCVELLEVVLAFGTGGISRADLAATLHRGDGDPALSALLAACEMWAVAWEVDDLVWVPGALRSLLPEPLGLAAPATELLAPRGVEDLTRRASALGLRAGRRKADILATLGGFYEDPDAILALVASAPDGAQALLHTAAWDGPVLRERRGDEPAGEDLDWLIEHGLALGDWHRTVVPREVVLALRGTGWHPALTPYPPEIAARTVGTEVVDDDATAAANAALDQVTAVLEACGAAPVAMRRLGGVGVREIRRLARTTGLDEAGVRLWLEIGYALGLLDQDGAELLPTAAYDGWAADRPGRRLADVARCWRNLATWPVPDSAGDAGTALSYDDRGLLATQLRHELLDAAAALAPGDAVADTADLQRVLRWHRPLICRAVGEAGPITDALWAEAARLGLTGRGGLSSLGRALVAGPERLAEVAEQVAHAGTDRAILQADLTVVVPGVPTADLARLLDSVADRESRGAAGVWRCSAESVRRALDGGATATGLVHALRQASTDGTVPQALEYLVTDVARRHGALRLRPAGCVLRCDDTGLLAEVAATRTLAGLRLSAIAPGVLVSARTLEQTLAALRQAGYAPVTEGVDGVPVLERRPARRAASGTDTAAARVTPPRARRAADPVDAAAPTRRHGADGESLAAIATRLLAAAHAERATGDDEGVADVPGPRTPEGSSGDGPGRARTGSAGGPRPAGDPATAVIHIPTLRSVQRAATRLTPAEQRLLAQAIDNELPVRIAYLSRDDDYTERVVEPREFDGRLVVAWCRLREDERAFQLSRIIKVEPVG